MPIGGSSEDVGAYVSALKDQQDGVPNTGLSSVHGKNKIAKGLSFRCDRLNQ